MKQNRTDLGKVVGANLRSLIKESAYRTQAEFAYAFGVDERTVRRWVSRGIEKVYIIDEIADFFKIDRMSLLSEREEVSPFYRTKRVLTLFKNICYNSYRQRRFIEN
jgi:hypothetical protein